MRAFFFVLVITVLTLTGAARGSDRVEVESGKSVNISIETPGDVRRVTLQKCGKTKGRPIILHCSSEEEKNGCSAEESDRFTITTDSEGFSVTLVDARFSDEDCYLLSYIDFANMWKDKEFTVKVNEQPSSTISPPSSTAEGIAVGTAAVILTIIGVCCIIKCLKRKKNNACEDPVEIASLSSTSFKSEATGESTKMVDETESSVDNNSQREEEGKNLNHNERNMMTAKTVRTQNCVDSQNNHRG